MANVDNNGVLLHARHAFMPNKLGYCGPDDHGRILENLRESMVDEKLVSTLKDFEAAYPFVKMIAKSSGRQPFDRQVVEAYWIGNKLLERVAPAQFYDFTLSELKKSNRSEIKALFSNLRNLSLPHHTFYVLNTATSVLSDSHHTSSVGSRKMGEVIDNCRISWGKVVKLDKNKLTVKYRPLAVNENTKIEFGPFVLKQVGYDRLCPPFDRVSLGAYVSMHWNSACHVLSKTQVKNLKEYSEADVSATNLFLSNVR